MVPVNGNILIDYVVKKEETTASGIYVAIDDKNVSRSAVVLDKGNCKLVNDGNTVIFEDWSMTEVEYNGKKLYFLDEKGIIAVT